jgi:hypothetical protein
VQKNITDPSFKTDVTWWEYKNKGKGPEGWTKMYCKGWKWPPLIVGILHNNVYLAGNDKIIPLIFPNFQVMPCYWQEATVGKRSHHFMVVFNYYITRILQTDLKVKVDLNGRICNSSKHQKGKNWTFLPSFWLTIDRKQL